MSKKLMRTSDVAMGYDWQQIITPYVIHYISRNDGKEGSARIRAFCSGAAVWLFMQNHPPEQYKIVTLYQELSDTAYCDYNAIGLKSRIEALKRNPLLTYQQEQEAAALIEERRSTYCPRNCNDFITAFTWLDTDTDTEH